MHNKPETIADEVKSHPGLVVLRGFDDCTPEEFWLLDMTGPEFERWWAGQAEFWHPVTEDLLELFGECSLRARPPMNLPGKFLPGQWDHYGPDDALSALWISLHESRRDYYCHLCCDPFSFLRAPDGRRIYHQGYNGPRL